MTPEKKPRLIEATKPAHPRPRAQRGGGNCRRRYFDSAGRPMTGAVTITRKTAHVAGDVVTVGPGRVDLVGGYLNVQLAPGEYELAAQLRTADGVGVLHKDVVTVPDA